MKLRMCLCLLLSLCLAGLPGFATALSCEQRSARTYLDGLLAEGHEVTAIAGYISREPWKVEPRQSVLPELLRPDSEAEPPVENTPTRDPNAPNHIAWPTVFGKVIDPDGTASFGRRNIRVYEYCALHWCGSFPPGPGPVLLFLTPVEDVLTVHIGPCGGGHFAAPSLEQLNAIEQCLGQGQCGPDTSILDELSGPPF